ncbi:hypothetical protein [Niallia sp. RD1]|uniref:hypothetical protein n=1 Tax=Niallia sp. RD1 TaxID=2962858 RepID=UPI0020C199FE|nr:hypothetical protein [Niallia sp. RD1]UTI39876.1 hypothetical protein NKG37_12990 [Niallia sp. RD1]
MKKFFKFGCLGLIALVVLIIVLAIAFSGDDDKVSTGADGKAKTSETTAAKKDDGSKKVDASSVTAEEVGLKIGLGEVKITKNKIQVGINLENTNDQVVMFYPDQGSAVVGDMQLEANLFLTDGNIGGEIQGGVKQDGIIEFLAPEGKQITVDDIKEIKLALGDVVSEDFTQSKAVNLTIEVK